MTSFELFRLSKFIKSPHVIFSYFFLLKENNIVTGKKIRYFASNRGKNDWYQN